MLYLGTSDTGCHTYPAAVGVKSEAGVTSLWTSALVSTGSASLPTKTRIKTMAAIDVRATIFIAASPSASPQRGRRVSERDDARSETEAVEVDTATFMSWGAGNSP